jgi:hypothetical protein
MHCCVGGNSSSEVSLSAISIARLLGERGGTIGGDDMVVLSATHPLRVRGSIGPEQSDGMSPPSLWCQLISVNYGLFR